MRHFYIQNDHVAKFVAEFRRDHPEEYKLLGFVNENYTVKTSACRMEEASRRIRIENLDMLENKQRLVLCNRGGCSKEYRNSISMMKS